ncbi:MAG: hypothetical protein GY737_15775 [Desulfobacteraceae bacterium]|nr:hypothetical protein [Desulfobacteraceae bacterium]
MTYTIEKIFNPSVGVEIVFNLSSLSPSSMPSIIYDVDHARKRIVIAQSLIPIKPSAVPKEVHLTTLVKGEKGNQRVGIKCKPVKFDNSYRLSSNNAVGAITVEYEPGIIDTNIRAGYRLPLGQKYKIKAKLNHKGINYASGKEFFILDISLSGIGIIIPKIIGKGKRNPLTRIERGEHAKIGIVFINEEDPKKNITIPSIIQIARVNTSYSETRILAGTKFVGLKPVIEEELNRFIHKAQMKDLKRLSGM